MLRIFRIYSKRKIRTIVNPQYRFQKESMSYMGWSFISNVLISVENVLGMHSMLSTVGKESTEIVASFNYIGKDLFGQIGGIWYMHRIGSETDNRPRYFVKKSMYIQQLSIIAECATPLLPSYLFIPVAGLANVGKNASFTGLGAVNAKVIQGLSGNYTGELYTKISAVNTLASTIGMGIGLTIAAKIPDHATRLAFVPFISILRTVTYQRALKKIKI